MIACFSPATAQAGIDVNIAPTHLPVEYELYICEWIRLPTDSGQRLSWVVHAGEYIPDLEFGTWDNRRALTMGDMRVDPNDPQSPWYFQNAVNGCTLRDPGGPPDQPHLWKTYWQTLHLDVGDEGTGLPESTVVQLSISEVPLWYDPIEQQWIPQDMWVHATPEPSTLCLLALGSLLVTKRRR